MRAPIPEMELVAAVIAQAALDLTAVNAVGWRSAAAREALAAAQDAAEWIDAGSDDPFGFGWCCDVVGADPDALRRALLPPAIRRRISALRRRIKMGISTC